MKNVFILSDIHLGASSSVLTAIDDNDNPNQAVNRPAAEIVLVKLLEDLKVLCAHQPISHCILLGDIFDLSFAAYDLAMANGLWFFEQLAAANLFETLIYIPGNHDHHLWQQISEAAYWRAPGKPSEIKTLPPTQVLTQTFLDALIPAPMSLAITYPNYAFTINGHAFFCHHGHFLQKLYLAASDFLAETIQTQDITDLETLNAPFLEFGWYNLGQAYNIGNQKLMDRLYFMFKNGNTQALDKLFKLFLHKINRLGLYSEVKHKSLSEWLTSLTIKWLGPFILKHLFFKQTWLFRTAQRASSGRHKRLTPGMRSAIEHYLSQYLLPEAPSLSECTFIYGHTHEPEDETLPFAQASMMVRICNTGGWVVDQLDANQQFVLPQIAPIYIDVEGTVHTLAFTEQHRDFLTAMLQAEPVFQRIKQQLMMP